jgi:hypothetical protein
MSKELDYFPPNGTKWKWESKTLQHSPWICCLSTQRERKLFTWPLSIVAVVDLADGLYHWTVEVCDFRGDRSALFGFSDDPLKACLDAEKFGELRMDDLLPDWARTALVNKWRPPVSTKWT